MGVPSNSLSKYLDELRSIPPEKPLEPELKQEQQQQDLKIREEHDLRSGAVLQAEVEPGEGEESPSAGDLVYVHVTVRTEDDDVVYSTRSQCGGNGQALAFILEKGKRAPRAWEIVLKGMRKKQICMLQVKPSYGYQHPDCGMEAPKGVPSGERLAFELQLVHWYPAEKVRPLPLNADICRRLVQEGTGWESPRPPFEVTFHCTACSPAYDGTQMTGFKYFSSTQEAPVRALMGSGQLPPGVEAALTSMTQGERVTFVVPSALMRPEAPQAGQQEQEGSSQACLLPSPPSNSTQVELELELLGLVQVRDMTGDGSVVKRRLRQGTGEFPIDCPLEDTTVWIHYRVRPLQLSDSTNLMQHVSSEEAMWAFDTKARRDQPSVEFDTGCGDMPEALEMAIKLMVPGETSRVVCLAHRAYEGRSDAPAGIKPSDPVEFEVELEKFDREGHWQNLSMAERFVIAEKMKAKGNALFRAKKYQYARSRYERLLRMMDSTRDFELQEDVDKMDEFKLAVLSNLVLCCFNQAEYAQAVTYATKGLQHHPDSAKLLLRKARALSMKGNYDLAEEDLKACQELELDSAMAKEVEQELVANKRRSQAAEVKQKKTFANFFDR